MNLRRFFVVALETIEQLPLPSPDAFTFNHFSANRINVFERSIGIRKLHPVAIFLLIANVIQSGILSRFFCSYFHFIPILSQVPTVHTAHPHSIMEWFFWLHLYISMNIMSSHDSENLVVGAVVSTHFALFHIFNVDISCSYSCINFASCIIEIHALNYLVLSFCFARKPVLRHVLFSSERLLRQSGTSLAFDRVEEIACPMFHGSLQLWIKSYAIHRCQQNIEPHTQAKRTKQETRTNWLEVDDCVASELMQKRLSFVCANSANYKKTTVRTKLDKRAAKDQHFDDQLNVWTRNAHGFGIACNNFT